MKRAKNFITPHQVLALSYKRVKHYYTDFYLILYFYNATNQEDLLYNKILQCATNWQVLIFFLQTMLYPTFLIYFWLLTYVLQLLKGLLVASFFSALSCGFFLLFMRVHQSGVYRCKEQGSCSELLWVWGCQVVGEGCDEQGWEQGRVEIEGCSGWVQGLQGVDIVLQGAGVGL